MAKEYKNNPDKTFLDVLEENYRIHKSEGIVDEDKARSAQDMVSETYEDLIAIYKANFQQNKVSDFYFKDAFLVKCDRLLRDKGNSSKETNECISIAFDDTIKEYASIIKI